MTCVAFSPDGALIVSGGSEDDETVIWALPDRPMNRLHARAFSLAFSPDGQHLACGCHEGVVKIYSRKGWKQLLSQQAHQGHVASIAYSNDGLWMATGSYDNSLKLWKMPNYDDALLLQAHEGSVYGVAFSPDSKLLASVSSDETLRLWDLPE